MDAKIINIINNKIMTLEKELDILVKDYKSFMSTFIKMIDENVIEYEVTNINNKYQHEIDVINRELKLLQDIKKELF